MIKIDKIKETWTCLTSVFDLILFHECFTRCTICGVFSWKIHPNALVVRWVGDQVWHEETWGQGNLRTILWEKDRTGWFIDLGSMVGEHGRKSLSWRNHAVPFADICAEKSRFVRFWYGLATFTSVVRFFVAASLPESVLQKKTPIYIYRNKSYSVQLYPANTFFSLHRHMDSWTGNVFSPITLLALYTIDCRLFLLLGDDVQVSRHMVCSCLVK